MYVFTYEYTQCTYSDSLFKILIQIRQLLGFTEILSTSDEVTQKLNSPSALQRAAALLYKAVTKNMSRKKNKLQ
jgi:hypothetical protein